jgi:hypothetical protein
MRERTALPAFARRALLVAGSLVLALVGSELALRVWLALAGQAYDAAAGRAQIEVLRSQASNPTPRAPGEVPAPGAGPAPAGQEPLAERFLHPFLGWEKGSSGAQWREERQRLRRGQERTYDIVVVGGSVSEVFAAQGFARLRKLLTADPRLSSRDVRLSCWGRGGYKAPQTAFSVAWLIANGSVPDAVILIDGFNEVAIGVQNSVLGVHPLFPSAVHWASLVQGGAFDREIVDLFVTARGSQRAAEDLGDLALERGLTHSALLQRLVARRMRLHLARMRNAFEQSANAMRERVAGEVLSGPALDPAEPLMDAVVRAWTENSRTLDGLCRGRGIMYLNVLQPTLHDEGAKPMSPEELRDCAIGPAWGRGVAEGYPALRAAGARLVAQGVPFADTSRVFADTHETLYYDSCHFGPEGNRLFAEAIAAAFLERLPAELDASAQGGVPGAELEPVRWSSSGATRRRRIEGERVYLCLPDGELAFAVPEGAREASGRFGMADETRAASDGVTFSVELESADGGSRRLLERVLDPRAREQDRSFQSFQVALDEGVGRTLVLRTRNEPGHDETGDVAFWSGIAFR